MNEINGCMKPPSVNELLSEMDDLSADEGEDGDNDRNVRVSTNKDCDKSSSKRKLIITVASQSTAKRCHPTPEIWKQLPEELLTQILVRLAADGSCKHIATACGTTCKIWNECAKADIIWKAVCSKYAISVQNVAANHVWKHFKKSMRNGRLARRWIELYSGWEWLKLKVSSSIMVPGFYDDVVKRCQNVAIKLTKKNWILLYESVSLMFEERVEEDICALREWNESNENADAEAITTRLLEAWDRYRLWLQFVCEIFGSLDWEVAENNERVARSSYITPSVFYKGLIIFRDKLLLAPILRNRLSTAVIEVIKLSPSNDLDDTATQSRLAEEETGAIGMSISRSAKTALRKPLILPQSHVLSAKLRQTMKSVSKRNEQFQIEHRTLDQHLLEMLDQLHVNDDPVAKECGGLHLFRKLYIQPLYGTNSTEHYRFVSAIHTPADYLN